jgi:AcrR family transcriptional regulator
MTVVPLPGGTTAGCAGNEAEAAAPERARPGRPRSTDCDRAILAATLASLVEDGYGGLSVEGVATRAQVGKATIYRRWPTKTALVVEAVGACAFEHVPLVDTGDVRADLAQMLHALQELMAREAPLMRAFAVERTRHPELDEAWRRGFLTQRREALREALRRGVERGQLPAGTDVELLADVGPALMWHRVTMLGEQAPAADLPDRILAQFLPASERPACEDLPGPPPVSSG